MQPGEPDRQGMVVSVAPAPAMSVDPVRAGDPGAERPRDSVDCLLSYADLAARWQTSARTIRRHVGDGSLRSVTHGGRVGFSWSDVHAFEGGPPPAGLEAAYRAPLLTPADVARLCPYRPSTLRVLARQGLVPHRRVGVHVRFVRAEVEAWLGSWQVRGARNAVPRSDQAPGAK